MNTETGSIKLNYRHKKPVIVFSSAQPSTDYHFFANFADYSNGEIVYVEWCLINKGTTSAQILLDGKNPKEFFLNWRIESRVIHSACIGARERNYSIAAIVAAASH